MYQPLATAVQAHNAHRAHQIRDETREFRRFNALGRLQDRAAVLDLIKTIRPTEQDQEEEISPLMPGMGKASDAQGAVENNATKVRRVSRNG